MPTRKPDGRLILRLVSLAAWLFASGAWAQGEPSISVHTQDGVSFVLPAGLRELPVPSAQQHDTETEHVYVDAGSPPLRVFVSRNTSQPNQSLPQLSPEVTRNYHAGFMSGLQKTLQLSDIREVMPGTYQPEHSSFSIALSGRASDADTVIASVAFFVRAGSSKASTTSRNQTSNTWSGASKRLPR